MAFSLHKEGNKTVFTDHAKACPLLEEAEYCSFQLEILQMQLVVSLSSDSFSVNTDVLGKVSLYGRLLYIWGRRCISNSSQINKISVQCVLVPVGRKTKNEMVKIHYNKTAIEFSELLF